MSDDGEDPSPRPKRKIKKVMVLSSEYSSESDDSGPTTSTRKKRLRVLSDDGSDSSSGSWLAGAIRRRALPALRDSGGDSDTSGWATDHSDAPPDEAAPATSPTTSKTAPKKPMKSISGFSSDSSEGNSEKCSICLMKFLDQEVGTPQTCEHIFCLDCITEWSKNMNTCPVDRITFESIIVRACAGGRVLRSEPVKVEERRPSVEMMIIEDPTVCEVCHDADQEEYMLLCDGCDLGYHMQCLSPPLTQIPEYQWLCPNCDGMFVTSFSMTVSQQRALLAEVEGASEGPSTSSGRRRASRAPAPRTAPAARPRRAPAHRTHRRRYKRRKTETLIVEYEVEGDGKFPVTKRKKVKTKIKKRKTKKRAPRTAARRTHVRASVRARLAALQGEAGGAAAGGGRARRPVGPPGLPALSLFGSAHDLDYFEDDGAEQGASAVAALGPTSSILSAYRQARRKIVTIPSPPHASSAPDILSNILESQALLHSKRSVVSVSAGGDVHISLQAREGGRSERAPPARAQGLDLTQGEDAARQAPAYPGQGRGWGGGYRYPRDQNHRQNNDDQGYGRGGYVDGYGAAPPPRGPGGPYDSRRGDGGPPDDYSRRPPRYADDDHYDRNRRQDGRPPARRNDDRAGRFVGPSPWRPGFPDRPRDSFGGFSGFDDPLDMRTGSVAPRGPAAPRCPNPYAAGPEAPRGPNPYAAGFEAPRGPAAPRGPNPYAAGFEAPRGPAAPRGPNPYAAGPAAPRGPNPYAAGPEAPRGPAAPRGPNPYAAGPPMRDEPPQHGPLRRPPQFPVDAAPTPVADESEDENESGLVIDTEKYDPTEPTNDDDDDEREEAPAEGAAGGGGGRGSPAPAPACVRSLLARLEGSGLAVTADVLDGAVRQALQEHRSLLAPRLGAEGDCPNYSIYSATSVHIAADSSRLAAAAAAAAAMEDLVQRDGEPSPAPAPAPAPAPGTPTKAPADKVCEDYAAKVSKRCPITTNTRNPIKIKLNTPSLIKRQVSLYDEEDASQEAAELTETAAPPPPERAAGAETAAPPPPERAAGAETAAPPPPERAAGTKPAVELDDEADPGRRLTKERRRSTGSVPESENVNATDQKERTDSASERRKSIEFGGERRSVESGDDEKSKDSGSERAKSFEEIREKTGDEDVEDARSRAASADDATPELRDERGEEAEGPPPSRGSSRSASRSPRALKMTESISETEDERSYTPCLDENKSKDASLEDGGLEGLDTELVSEEEAHDMFSEGSPPGAARRAAPAPEEGEIPDRRLDPDDDKKKKKDGKKDKERKAKRRAEVAFKKVKSKERNYRERDKDGDKEKRRAPSSERSRARRRRDKRQDLERYDVRTLVSERRRRAKDAFGRDVSPSRSRSPSAPAASPASSSPPPARRAPPSPEPRRARFSSSPRRRPSPSPRRRASPSPRRRASPSPRRRTSPSPRRRVSPSPRRRVSPSPRRRVSPSPRRRVSPSPRRRPSPSPRRRASISPRRRVSPSPRRRASISPRRRASPSPRRVRTSPSPRASSSPKRRRRRSRSRLRKRRRSASPVATPKPAKAKKKKRSGSKRQSPRRRSARRKRPRRRSASPAGAAAAAAVAAPAWSPEPAPSPRTPPPPPLPLEERRRRREVERAHRRLREAAGPSKEVFTSGDNILVSVSFKEQERAEGIGRRERRRERKRRRRLAVGAGAGAPAATAKPVAIIDLERSPFRELTPSPKNVIVLSDDDAAEAAEAPPAAPQTAPPAAAPQPALGPKTPPEPPQPEPQQQPQPQPQPAELSAGEARGPLTPPLAPESPDAYDPYEPTRSASNSPPPAASPPPAPAAPAPPPAPADEERPTMTLEAAQKTNLSADQLLDRRPLSPIEKVLALLQSTRDVSPEPPPREAGASPAPAPAPALAPAPAPAEQVPRAAAEAPRPPLKLFVAKPSPIKSDPIKPMPARPARVLPLPALVAGVRRGASPPAPAPPGAGASPYSPGSSDFGDLFEPPPPAHAPRRRRARNGKASRHSKGKTTVEVKLDDDNLRVLEELPSSAVEMQVKTKFLKKLNRQERVVEEVKHVLKPHYNKKRVSKEEYKHILRRAVPKICHNKTGEINPSKIQALVEAYVKKFRKKRKLNQ